MSIPSSIRQAMANKKGGLVRKGSGDKGMNGNGLSNSLMKKRIIVLNQEKCKPNSEAFLYLSRVSHMCKRKCIIIKDRRQIAHEEGIDHSKNKCEFRDLPAQHIEILESACAQCMLRAKRCPGNVVNMVNLPSDLQIDCTHRYGPNSFKLYGLPSPHAGCVLGILGTNGIGKSTALKVLSGKLKPNLGRLKTPPSWQEIISYYRGSDMQKYLVRLLENDFRCVTKVQLDADYVHKLKGRIVGDVLREHDQRNVMNYLVDKLGLISILDRQVQDLSGGELQCFAICLVCQQDADVYLFDEASSFLDIKQRMTITEVIRGLTNISKKDGRQPYVMVVEHDLAVLDYMSDYINCFYGEPGIYGVVSKVATVTNGINNYLNGYFPAENIRFRPDSISFSVSSANAEMDRLVTNSAGSYNLTEFPSGTSLHYPAMSHAFEGEDSSFTLNVEEGYFIGAECVGILGRNGCGKTMFMDMLAGHVDRNRHKGIEVAKASKVSLARLGVSYKRQVYAPKLRKFEGTVKEIIDKQIRIVCSDRLFKLLVIKPLKIDELYEKHVNFLSGGELQRLAITLCLGKPANVYLLDEPSAGLDCEQRIIAAKVIKRWIVNHLGKISMVVEHDFIMAAALADKVIVYDGQPGVECTAHSPVNIVDGFNSFLDQLNVTFRRDPVNWRPRVNKTGSQNDQMQKRSGQLFMMDVDLQ